MKHFSGVLASSHLLDRLLRCINASPPAMRPSVCQCAHIGEQRGSRREPLVRTAGENISHGGSFDGMGDVGLGCFASGIGIS